MQKFISQIPELTHFLSQSHKKQHPKIIRQLILLGINAAQTKCHKQKHKQCDDIVNQIDRIKQNLHQLNHLVKYQCPTPYGCIYNQSAIQNLNHYNNQQNYNPQRYNQPIHINTERVNSQPAQKDHFQQQGTSKLKNRETEFKNRKNGSKSTHNPFLKQKTNFRHHLDDTQAREVLNYPAELMVQVHHPIKRKSQDYKKHIYQEEINKQELTKIKLQDENEPNHDFTRRNRSQTDYHKAQSKIKSLLDKDRIRFMQKQRDESFKQGFNKYEYSDQNEMQEESSFNEQTNKINESNNYNFNQSSFKASNKASSSHKSKPSSKKDVQKSRNQVSSKIQVSYADQQFKYDTHSRKSSEKDINMPLKVKQTQTSGKLYRNNQQQEQEQEQDSSNDMISNSSSFSQFSINGSRRKQVGKISRKKDDN